MDGPGEELNDVGHEGTLSDLVEGVQKMARTVAMKWKMVGLIPRDGVEIKVDGYELTLRGAVGKALVLALPRCLFDGAAPFQSVIRRAMEIAREQTGLRDVLAVEEGVEFLRLVPVDLDDRISEALGECESCCLNNETDKKRVFEVLKSKLLA